MKICVDCESEYDAAGRRCGACRGRRNRAQQPVSLCPDCGKPKTAVAARCRACAGLAARKTDKAPIKRPDGYMKVRVPEHPRAVNGYVFEHVIVMETVIGRYLVDGENVHHVNGIRDDNRPENLELWTKPQPSGIRAEDAYRYALELVERYKPLFGEDAA